MIIVNVARDFTRFPSGRYEKNGATSGETFRKKFLVPHIENKQTVRVELDGTIGYGSSFLEEAFGGLVRQLQVPGHELLKMLELDSSDKTLIEEINQYVLEATFNK